TWTVTTATGGTANYTLNGVSSPLTFTGVENLIGGTGTDTFSLSQPPAGIIDGGAGTDILDFRAAGTAVTVNLQNTPNFETIYGSNLTTDTLIGPSADTTWTILGKDSGNAGAVAFFGVERLVGGGGADLFQVTKGVNSTTLFASLDGGAGSNTL